MSCDVCRREPVIAVGASTCGPVSFAYCRSCLRAGAEPYGTVVAYFASGRIFGRADLAESYHPVLDATLAVAGKSEEQFWNDVRSCGETEDTPASRAGADEA